MSEPVEPSGVWFDALVDVMQILMRRSGQRRAGLDALDAGQREVADA